MVYRNWNFRSYGIGKKKFLQRALLLNDLFFKTPPITAFYLYITENNETKKKKIHLFRFAMRIVCADFFLEGVQQ